MLHNSHGLGTADSADDLLPDLWHTLLASQRLLATINAPARRIADLCYRHPSRTVGVFTLNIGMPGHDLRQQIWQHYLAQSAFAACGPELVQAASQYLFTEEQTGLIIREASDRLSLLGEASPCRQILLETCRAQSHREMLSVATEINSSHSLRDLVLPAHTQRNLNEILQYARQRHQVLEDWGFDSKNRNNQNLCILFYGHSGTGKTMAASVLANELNLGLYRIDLAQIVSKYIGETEKHLAQLFDQAEAMNIVLFFDEAESLFARRTESRDAHDRYANLQTGFLLQRIESFAGIVILATNLLANIDPAFTRRFNFMLEFPFPDSRERLQLWQSAFPPATPLAADLDFTLLAQKAALSGANINNIALSAAFLAAAEQQPVGQAHLLAATEREYNKLGKAFHAADFIWQQED